MENRSLSDIVPYHIKWLCIISCNGQQVYFPQILGYRTCSNMPLQLSVISQQIRIGV